MHKINSRDREERAHLKLSTPQPRREHSAQRAQCTEKRDEGRSERECFNEVRVCERVLGF